ncbi:U-box domain-containing protein 2 [Striga hermonthica]|uniref:RING-type E3 ubiquitin transferase n=1 Tax=Striga hermonthica TaxID=68872 RepID=A0A9N7N732_STRHE|nr:U-box domain-containing protein 2 [Striga hermonthica]
MGSMDLTPLKCLINSISRFIHLVTCRVSAKMPAEKDYINVISMLKHLKPLLDDFVDHNTPSDEAFSKECEQLDLAVNEAREFLEKWSPRMSKILCVLQSKPLVLKIQICSVKLSCALCGHFELSQKTSSLSNARLCAQECQKLKLGQLPKLIENAVECEKDGKPPDGEHLMQIMEFLNLKSSEELLNEYISVEKENKKAQQTETKQDLDRISQILTLMSHLRDHAVKLDIFKAPNGISVPSYFRCPLSLQLMSDPVIIASGQTYERASVQKWLDHGLETCPQTGHRLSHQNLTPNYTVKALIVNWCNENNVRIPQNHEITNSCPQNETEKFCCQSSPEHSYVHSRSESASSAVSSIDYTPSPEIESSRLLPSNPDSAGYTKSSRQVLGPSPSELTYDELTTASRVEKLVEGLKSPSTDTQAACARELRLLARHNRENRVIIDECRAIGPLISLLRSEAREVQEHAVTALLNLSINDSIKARIAGQGALDPLIHVLSTGTPVARENAAAALFSISRIEEYRVKIGRSGAVRALVELLGNGSIRGKKDAATALFNLSICHENKARIVQAGAVRHLAGMVVEPRGEMVDKAVALLANLTTVGEGCAAVAREEGAVGSLVEVVESGSHRGKENAASVLLQMCMGSARYCRSVLQEGAVPPLVALSQSGTPRAKEKAQQLLSHFRNQRESALARGRS